MQQKSYIQLSAGDYQADKQVIAITRPECPICPIVTKGLI